MCLGKRTKETAHKCGAPEVLKLTAISGTLLKGISSSPLLLKLLRLGDFQMKVFVHVVKSVILMTT